MEQKSYSTRLAGRTLTFEFGRYAQQAGGSVLVRLDDTVILVCATASDTPREGQDFFPLSCDYEEKLYAVGRIPGGWIRREGRPTEKATLTSRLIDRPMRPLFPKGLRNDVQVVATALSVDTNVPPEIPAMLGASMALCVSEIPFGGPVGAVVVGRVNGEFVVNPNDEDRGKSDLHLVVAGTSEAVLMVEAGANEVSEQVMLDGILLAHEEIKKLVEFQQTIAGEIGKPKKEFPLYLTGEDIAAAVQDYAREKVEWVFGTFDRGERQRREDEVGKDVQERFAEEFPGRSAEIADALYAMKKKVMRARILSEGVRPDGRKLTEVRPIWCEVGLLPRTHGSAVFTRGETQALTVATLGSMREVQNLDGLTNEETKRYMHHYNFPPYSTGEAGRMRSPGRREIGHGALAERALQPMIPSEDVFPYAIRLVSEVLSSNGSTSQASVCASTLSLMDAGVPIKAPVAGVAMGLIKDAESGQVAVLTDIQGLEDFLGDMDFKVAGTMNGVTAIQMDIKIKGIDEQVLRQALKQALDGRLHILSKMLEALPEPRQSLSKYAPKITSFMINPEKIREVIGSGGKVINKIIADTGVKIDIEDDGHVFIATSDDEAASKARKIIEAIAKDVQVGDVFTGKVARIMPFGAFVEFAPGKDGMIHISKLSTERVEKIEDAVKIGDELEVRVSEVDSQGRINLVRNDLTYAGGDIVRRPPMRGGDRDHRGGPPRGPRRP
ncbi:MAG: polyribonucleotide nucleotidyltransferase [Oscillospiraceae bacterium]|jgi:polyribonucleotide nucleotidyltransferase|nr:polyribonucleotide nucleotidyltransferase [Oscillospiraceae bacterium]